MGFGIDYYNTQVVNPNTELASSVKELIQQRGCDVSVIIIKNSQEYYFLIINNYDKNSNVYWTTIYPLYQ